MCVSIAWQVASVGSSSTVHTLHRYTCLHMRTFSNTFPPPLPADVMLYTRSSRRLYRTPRTTSPLSRSLPLARTRASRGSARGRRGRGAGFPTADTAPPTPGHIPREVSFPQPQLKGGVCLHVSYMAGGSAEFDTWWNCLLYTSPSPRD